jgi:hypothetical protein
MNSALKVKDRRQWVKSETSIAASSDIRNAPANTTRTSAPERRPSRRGEPLRCRPDDSMEGQRGRGQQWPDLTLSYLRRGR